MLSAYYFLERDCANYNRKHDYVLKVFKSIFVVIKYKKDFCIESTAIPTQVVSWKGWKLCMSS